MVLSVEDDIGKEVVIRYETKENGFDNAGEFFTDANGRQFMRRIKDQRLSFDLEDGDVEPVASNYYPITTGIFTTNGQSHMSILTDRSEGGSSLAGNQIEVMVHRRLLVDDDFGVNEALNETAHGVGLVARGTHLLHLGQSDSAPQWRRQRMQEQFMKPTLFFVPTTLTQGQWQSGYPTKTSSALASDLPQNINILTLAPEMGTNNLVLRLEHLYEANETDSLGQEVVLDLNAIFDPNSVSFNDFMEMTLGANQPLATAERLHWNTNKWHKDHDLLHNMAESRQMDSNIELQPMDIRTFILVRGASEPPNSALTMSANVFLMLWLSVLVLTL